MKTFEEFLFEAKSPDEVVNTMNRNWNRNQNRNSGESKSNFNLQYRKDPEPHLYVGLIDIAKKRQGRGIGSRYLRASERVADRYKLPMTVKPVAPKPKNQNKLERLYMRHGFDYNKNNEISSHPMIRKSKK